MEGKVIRQKFLDFFESKGHTILPSAALVPKEDPTVLFNTAGMQPLVPFLMGQPHSGGKRLANSQKCIRTDDIEEVGDNRHLTFFEMLGSWSLGDYFKQESITWGFEFLTSKEWLGLDPNRLFVTVYQGNSEVPEDNEAIQAWKKEFEKVGINPSVGSEYNFDDISANKPDAKYIYRIRTMKGKDNWWGLPYRGPCGPCSEIYYLANKHPINFEESILPNLTDEEKFDFIDNQIIEIWNHVFMQFEGEKDSSKEPINISPMVNKNIDTGMGLERLVAVINGLESVQETDLLSPIGQVALKWSRA